MDADIDTPNLDMYTILYISQRLLMRSITCTNAMQNLTETMEAVCQDHTPIMITREKGPSVIMMSLEDYTALEETAYLLRSPNNARKLIESISQLEDENGIERDLVE